MPKVDIAKAFLWRFAEMNAGDSKLECLGRGFTRLCHCSMGNARKIPAFLRASARQLPVAVAEYWSQAAVELAAVAARSGR